jgi:predicted RNase H-like nuclease
LAAAERELESVCVTDLRIGTNVRETRDILSKWISGSSDCLLAFDSPLGWPAPLGPSLETHYAGGPIPISSNELFRRETDRTVRERLRKQSLDVGADRIARTAVSTLGLIQDLRDELSIEIPLAWSPDHAVGAAAIEVYPAATLIGHSLRSSGYKDTNRQAERDEIVKALSKTMALRSEHMRLAEANADLLDALVCVLAGDDFLSGDCVEPENRSRAAKEGWIWFRTVGER